MRRARRLAAQLAAVLLHRSGVLEARRRRRHQRGDFRLFVLEYHEVTDVEEYEGAVSEARFRRHLDYLGERYRFESLAGAVDRLNRADGPAEDLLVVTFDDGYRGNHDSAWRCLRERQLPATVFLTTNFLDGDELWFDFARRAIGSLRTASHPLPAALLEVSGGHGQAMSADAIVERLKYAAPADKARALGALRESAPPTPAAAEPLGWEQVRTMRDQGCEFGGHTLSHPILSTLGAEAQRAEIRGSRERIAEELGAPPSVFAFPNGSRRDFDETSLQILAEEGFTAACTTIRGSNRPGENPLTLRRLGVGPDSIALLAARLSGVFDPPGSR